MDETEATRSVDFGTAPSTTTGVASMPRRLGSYTILRLIATGGMGAVYEAEQAQPKRHVALKVIRPDRLSEQVLRRFRIEPEVLGQLQHAGIAQIFEAGTEQTPAGQWPFFAMEMVRGLPLDEFATRRNLGVRDRLMLMITVARAVHHAHQHSVVHRDLKPANILVDDAGHPKILDFGLALVTDTDVQRSILWSEIGSVVGTPEYLSPEQTEGDPRNLDLRSDVYSLGVLTFKLVAGCLPYRLASDPSEAFCAIRNSEPTKLGDVHTTLGGDLETVVAKALKKDKEQRYQSAQEYGDDLDRVVNGVSISVTPATWAAKFRRWTMREDRIRQTSLAVMAMAGVASFFQTFYTVIGLTALLGWMKLNREARLAEFTILMAAWALLLAVLTWLNSKAMQNHLSALWISLTSAIAMAVFMFSAAANVIPYDAGGGLVDPLARELILMLGGTMALVGGALNSIALVTSYRVRRWKQPPTWTTRSSARS